LEIFEKSIILSSSQEESEDYVLSESDELLLLEELEEVFTPSNIKIYPSIIGLG